MQNQLSTTFQHFATLPAPERLARVANSRVPVKRDGRLGCEDTIIVNWQPLQVPLRATFSCDACGLPSSACSRSYRIPGLAGRFHCISCLESVLFGPGRCRWCGAKLNDRGGRRFCSEGCGKRSNATPFGNGQRLLNHLRRHHPNLHHQVTGKALQDAGTQARSAAGVCLCCQGSLTRKRGDARFCSPRCKTRYHRSLAKTQNAPISRNTNIPESTTCSEPKSGVGLHHSGRGTTRLQVSVIGAHSAVTGKQHCLGGSVSMNRAQKGGAR